MAATCKIVMKAARGDINWTLAMRYRLRITKVCGGVPCHPLPCKSLASMTIRHGMLKLHASARLKNMMWGYQ
jgi:hypothetical protein